VFGGRRYGCNLALVLSVAAPRGPGIVPYRELCCKTRTARTFWDRYLESAPPAVTLYSLVHREEGSLSTNLSEEEAQRELEAVLRDEPDWVDDLNVGRFEVIVVAEGAEPN
jgi:hypothetical protein